MRYFAGLDVSVNGTSICIIEDEGQIVREMKVLTEPATIVAELTRCSVIYGRVGLEAGPLSQWLYDGLPKLAQRPHIAKCTILDSSLPSGARPEQESCQKSHYSELLSCARCQTRQNQTGAVAMQFGNDPTLETGFSAARETSEKFAALRSLTRTIFGRRQKRSRRLNGRCSIPPFRGSKLPKPRSISADTTENLESPPPSRQVVALALR